jgi:hypothetical protein
MLELDDVLGARLGLLLTGVEVATGLWRWGSGVLLFIGNFA